MNAAIAWFAQNRVAANLLVLIILVGGLLTVPQITKEVFPEFASGVIEVSVAYPGAAPEEVEEGICVRIEEAVQGLDGIKRINSVAAEGAGSVSIELLPGADSRKVLDDIKARVDAIDTFPIDAETPVVQEIVIRSQVLNVAVSGQADERTLKTLGEQVRDEISALPGITQVQLVAARPYEISVEVSEHTLRRFGLTFDEIAQAIRRSSLDLPGGSIKSEGGEILVRIKGQAYRGRDFEKIVLRAQPDGSRLLLGEVARVIDGFEDTDQAALFNGEPAVMVQVFRVGDQSALAISSSISNYIAEAQLRIPEGISLTMWQDYSSYLRSRLELLLRNARMGFLLVFLVLAMFMRLRLALWVSFGIPVSFLGTLWLMPGLDLSINLMSLFAFILVLGIVVDDAIVVGENIYTHQQRTGEGLRSAIAGAQEVAIPVIFSVLTTVAAFLPLIAVGGNTGKVLRVIPLIVIPTLVFSLIESKFVLPAHLSRYKRPPENGTNGGIFGIFSRIQKGFARLLERACKEVYRPLLEKVLHWRYLTLAVSISALAVIIGIIGGNWIKFTFLPDVEGDDIAVMLTMPQGTPPEVTTAAVRQIEQAAQALREELDRKGAAAGQSVFWHVLSSVGEQPYRSAQSQGAGNIRQNFTGSHLGEVHIQVAASEIRNVTSTEIVNRWRAMTPPIPDAVEVNFTASLFSPGEDVNVQLRGRRMEDLLNAVQELKTRLSEYPGVTDIADSFRAGKQEITLDIKPEAEPLGLMLDDLARQVRQGFYGEEAQRIQRGRDDLKVMVRYPEAERRSLGDLENMRIRTPDGDEVPFSEVATAEIGRGYAAIRRSDRQRSINVTANVEEGKGNANEIVNDIRRNVLPEILARYPGVTYTLEGERREQLDTMGGLFRGFILALFMIYALLAIPFRSYIQPFIVMSAIPFGLIGAVLGHLIMGLNLTILSMFGLVALTGVVVNGSLVLVDFINRYRASGHTLHEAIREAGVARFRPIWLTSLTTFAGLFPLILERSVQAQFLIPMAVSLGFGVLFSTLITLLLVPALYLVLEDIRWLFGAKPEETRNPDAISEYQPGKGV
jgi:multidrug efflux pump subunit AcrB